MENNILDYQEFYDELIQGEYLSEKITDEWMIDNENYLRETLYSFYQVYSKYKYPNKILKYLMKLFSEVTYAAFMNFQKKTYL